jgi:HSP20 family protein
MSYRDFRDIDLLRQMESEMQRLADETLRGFLSEVPAPNRFWQPRVDMHETPESVIVKVEISGVNPSELNLSLSSDDRVLTISGVRNEEDKERVDRIRCYQLEIYFGPFEREVVLPGDARIERDAINATYKDGFLLVTLPKREEQAAGSRSIPITG